MKKKSIWRIAANVPGEAEEAVLELFKAIFSEVPISYVDLETRLATVSLYFEAKPKLSTATRGQLAKGFNHIRKCGLNLPNPKLSVKRLPQQDWAESWKRHFHPIEIGSKLLIKPSWSKQRPKSRQTAVVLDPGLSFGTGQHATTEYCLRELVRWRGSELAHNRPSFLDVGTGSGILAIAAARLGYTPVDAFDFDPEAVRVASANAKRNHVLRQIHFSEQDVTSLPSTGHKYSLICANLISNLLIEARDRILRKLRVEGVIVIAGILRNEFPVVQECYERAGLELIKCGEKREWRSGSFAWRK